MCCNKEEPERVKLKKIAPNTRSYLLYLIVALLLTAGSLCVIDCKEVFTIWTSISCGCIASILVAWLIDAANCRQLNRKNQENREILFADLQRVFNNGIQILIYEAAKSEHGTKARTWYAWVELADKLSQTNVELVPLYNHSLMVFFDDVGEQVYVIKKQESVLLNAGIICEDDIRALSTILKVCDASKAVFQSKESHEACARFFKKSCDVIHATINSAPSLQPINDMLIEPWLYQTYLKSKKDAQVRVTKQHPKDSHNSQ